MTDDDKRVGFQKGNEEWVKSLPVRRVQNVAELRKMFRRMTGKAAKVAWEALDSDDERIRLTAAGLILDRGWGKATPQDPEMAESLANAHLEALKAITAGASADVVTETERQNLKKELGALPKVTGVSVVVEGELVEEVNDINDLGDAQVKEDLNGSEEEDETDKS